jgi:hypothetical protein
VAVLSLSEFWLFELRFSFRRVAASISSARIGYPISATRRFSHKKLFCSSNIYNEASETFAGA